MPCTHALQNLASQDSQHVCNSRCLRLCSHLLRAENAASVHRCIIWLLEVTWTNFFYLDFQSWFEQCRSYFTQQGRLSTAFLLAGMEPKRRHDSSASSEKRPSVALISVGERCAARADEDMKMLKKQSRAKSDATHSLLYCVWTRESWTHTDQEITTGVLSHTGC